MMRTQERVSRLIAKVAAGQDPIRALKEDDTIDVPAQIDGDYDYGKDQPEEDPEQADEVPKGDVQSTLDQQQAPSPEVGGQAPNIGQEVDQAETETQDQESPNATIDKALASVQMGDMKAALQALGVVPTQSVDQDTEDKDGTEPVKPGVEVDADTTVA